MGTFNDLERFTGGSYGTQLKADARRYYGSFINFSGRGEMVPNKDCYCEIDPDKKDKWGIPVLRFHWKWAEHETRQAQHMQTTFKQIIDDMGGTVVTTKELYPPGAIIHEVGTVCMGEKRTESVLNQHSQAWDVQNLFVMDGGPFVSNADKNPTLSIMALAWRSCDNLIRQFKARTL